MANRFLGPWWLKSSRAWGLTDRTTGQTLRFFSEEAARKYMADPEGNAKLPLTNSGRLSRQLGRAALLHKDVAQ